MSQQQLKRNDTSIQIMISEEDKLSPLSEPLKVLDRLKESLEHLPQLESFFKKYNEQLSIVTMSLNNVEKITKKSEQLTQDTLIMATKVKSAQKVISEDQLQITQLKREIEKQWSLFDSVKIKDEESQLKIEKLQNKFDQLQKEIQSGVINEERKRYIEQLEENEQKLRREFEMEQNLKISLINRLTVLQNEYDDLMKEKINILKQIEFMNKEVVELEKTIKEEQVEREKAKIELDEVKSLLKSKIRDIEDTQSKKERNEIELQRYEKKALEQSEKTSKAQRHVEELQFKLEKLQKEFKEQAKQTSKLSAGNENLRLLIKNKEDSIKITKEEQLVHLRNFQLRLKEKKKYEEKKISLELKKKKLENEVKYCKEQIIDMKRMLEFEKTKIEDLLHQKNLLDKSILKADKNLEEEESTLKVIDNKKHNVQLKFKLNIQILEKKRQDIYRLKKEIEKYDSTFLEAKQKHDQAQEEIKLKKIESDQLKIKIKQSKDIYKKQLSLFEAVKAERNSFSKKLIDAFDEIKQEKQKFKINDQQIKKIAEDIQNKEKEKEKLETNLNQYKSKSNLLEKEISEIEQAIKEQTDINKQHHFEIQKLNEIIKQADQERKRQEKEYEAVVNDRDILGAQLIKRNEELANLYERIKSQQALLYKGSIQYQQRLNEIEILNEKINQLQIQVKELENILIPNFKIKKNHINTLQKNLLQEQQRIKVLEDELNTPMNVHGWRKLQGSDPQNYENVKKIQKLQKQLIAKTEEVLEKDLLIKEKEKLYLELKNIIVKQPGPEVVEQYHSLKETLKMKQKTYDGMIKELNMYMLKVKELEYLKLKLSDDFFTLKSEYFNLKNNKEFNDDDDEQHDYLGDNNKITENVTVTTTTGIVDEDGPLSENVN
ncbi:hypothetical protein ABK040_015757 [Willaertia magna]